MTFTIFVMILFLLQPYFIVHNQVFHSDISVPLISIDKKTQVSAVLINIILQQLFGTSPPEQSASLY